MKIFYLLEYPLEIHGGAQLSTLYTAKELNKKYNIEIYIITPNYESIKDSDFEGINVIKLDSCYYRSPSPLRNPLAFLKVKKEIETLVDRYMPDIIHSQMPLSFIYNALINKNIIKIHTDRGLYSGYSSKTRFLYKILINKVDKIITTTNYNYIQWPIIEEKKEVIYNSISNYFNDNINNTYEKLRKYYSIDKEDIVIGFSGRFTYFKNWPFVLKLIKKLVTENIRFHLFISFAVNNNNQKEIQEFELLKENIYSIKAENIHIFQDLNQKEMADFYSPIDIFIIPSIFESFGKVAIEAMSKNCCILSSNVGGLPEVINNKEYVFELDINKFYTKIAELIINKSKLEESKKYFNERYFSTFTQEENTKKHYNLYLKIKNENENN